jgi:hypothetical protein
MRSSEFDITATACQFAAAQGTRHKIAHLFHRTWRRPVMQFVYVILFIVAAILAAGLIIGAAFKLIGFGIAALLVFIAVSWVMNKVRGPRTH